MASGTLLATQVALVAKNSPANARDQRCRSIPGSGRSPGGGNGKPFQYSCLKISWMEKPDGLQSVGSQTVGHNWSDLARMHFLKTLNLVWFYFFVFYFGIFFSSSCKTVCLLLKHQKYCVSPLWRQVSTILTLIVCMPLCMWLVSFISTFIFGAIQTLTSPSLHKNLVKQFVAVCQLYLKKMRRSF